MPATLLASLTPPSGRHEQRDPITRRTRCGDGARNERSHSPASERPEAQQGKRRSPAPSERARDMDFEFSADQELLRETVRRFLAERAPVTPYVRSMLDDTRGTTDAVWRGLADLGVTGLLVPEAHGGAGMGMVDAAVVLEELRSEEHTSEL